MGMLSILANTIFNTGALTLAHATGSVRNDSSCSPNRQVPVSSEKGERKLSSLLAHLEA